MSGELWAITSYFNPAGYRRRLENFRAFRSRLAAPLLAVELGFGGAPALGPGDADILVQCRDGDVMWQKERLLNHALARLPASCTAVAWIDCDLVFDDADWPAQACNALEDAPLLQLFGLLRHAPRDADAAALRGGTQGWTQPSLAALLAQGTDAAAALRAGMRRESGAPSGGMAWAARRELLEAVGLYDCCILGGGDTALCCAALGQPELAVALHSMNSWQRAAYLPWAGRLHARTGGRLAGLPGTVHHLRHGEMRDRQGAQRHASLAPHDFDPASDLVRGSDGAWRWARPKPALQALVRGYFAARREDG